MLRHIHGIQVNQLKRIPKWGESDTAPITVPRQIFYHTAVVTYKQNMEKTHSTQHITMHRTAMILCNNSIH